MKKLSKNYTLADLPNGVEFKHPNYESLAFRKNEEGKLQFNDAGTIDPLTLLCLFASLTPETDTGVQRDIFHVDPSTIIVAHGRNFMVNLDGDIIIEEYSEGGSIIHSQMYATEADAMEAFFEIIA